MRTSLPTVSKDDQWRVPLYRNATRQRTSDARDVIGTVCLQHILDGNPLPGVGGVVAGRIDVDTEGDHHVDLCLVYGLQYEMRKVTV